MWAFLRAYGRNEAGATSIEYAFIAGLIALVIIGAVTTIGTNVQRPFSQVSDNLK
jgi:pilus assembly protein Flp/PilA